MRALATAHPGCEAILAREVAAPGMPAPEIVAGGVELEVDDRGLALANIGLRTAGRVLVRVAEFHARSFAELERRARAVPWERFLGEVAAAHFRVTAKKSKLNHERGIAERLGRALAERSPATKLVEARGEVEIENREVSLLPTTQRFVVRFHRDICTISADASGPLLHRRGYRVESGKAPLRETLAAALLLSVGWDGSEPLIDPLCGSGTIPIEAALIANRIAPGHSRRFSFERWPGVSGTVVDSARRALSVPVPPVPIRIQILGSDRDEGAISAAKANAGRAGVGDAIAWSRRSLSAIEPPSSPGWIVTNPPYGTRVGERLALRDLYAQLGNVLRRRCPGWRIAMVSADRALERQVGLEWRVEAITENGGLPIRFVSARVPAR
jgi:putative N6-adenine-specific DNA methylase